MSSFNFTVLLRSVKAVKLAWAFVRLSHFCCNKTWCTPFSPSLANQISTRPLGLFSFGTSRETCAYQNAHQCLLLLPPPQSASLDCAMKKLSRMSNRVTLNIVWCSDLAVRRGSLLSKMSLYRSTTGPWNVVCQLSMLGHKSHVLSDLHVTCPLAPWIKKVKFSGPFKSLQRSRTWSGQFQKQLLSFRFPPFLSCSISGTLLTTQSKERNNQTWGLETTDWIQVVAGILYWDPPACIISQLSTCPESYVRASLIEDELEIIW